MGHLFLGDWFSFNRTSPILKFLCGRIHLFLACNCCRYSLLHLDQNSCAKCCVRLHLFLQYRSFSLLNSPGEGSTSLVFPVSSIRGDNGGAESGSLRVSTVRGLLLIVYSASQRKVLNDSSSRRLPCSLIRPVMTLLIDLICLSQTPPKLLAHAGFLIQSMFSLRSSALISWSSISSIAFLSSTSAPMKFVPLSQRISLTNPRLQMKRLSAFMNESVSKESATYMWTALLTKQVNKALYLFTTALPRWTCQGPKKSTPQ